MATPSVTMLPSSQVWSCSMPFLLCWTPLVSKTMQPPGKLWYPWGRQWIHVTWQQGSRQPQCPLLQERECRRGARAPLNLTAACRHLLAQQPGAVDGAGHGLSTWEHS